MIDTCNLQDVVMMKKPHACGENEWTVIRLGADVKIRCNACGRIVMLDREAFFKKCKKIIRPAQAAAEAE